MLTVSKPAPGERVKVEFEATVLDGWGGADRVNLAVDGSEEHFCAPPSAVTRIIPEEPEPGAAVVIGDVTWIHLTSNGQGWCGVRVGYPGWHKLSQSWEQVYRPGYKLVSA